MWVLQRGKPFGAHCKRAATARDFTAGWLNFERLRLFLPLTTFHIAQDEYRTESRG